MFYRVAAILLIPLVIGVSFSRLLVYASFEINRDYIAAALCENKDKPWLHCEGKCYLTKKLRQVEEKEKSQERQQQKNLIQDAFLPQKFNVLFLTKLIRIIGIRNPAFILGKHYALIFQPPRFYSIS